MTLRRAGAAPSPCRRSPAPGRRAPAAPCSMGRPGPSAGVRGGPLSGRRPGIPPSRRGTGERRRRGGAARGTGAACSGSPGGRRPGAARRHPTGPRPLSGSGRPAGPAGMGRRRLFEPPWTGLSPQLGPVRKLSGMRASSCPPGVARVSSDGNTEPRGEQGDPWRGAIDDFPRVSVANELSDLVWRSSHPGSPLLQASSPGPGSCRRLGLRVARMSAPVTGNEGSLRVSRRDRQGGVLVPRVGPGPNC